MYAVMTLMSQMWKLKHGGVKPHASVTQPVGAESGPGLASGGFQAHPGSWQHTGLFVDGGAVRQHLT